LKMSPISRVRATLRDAVYRHEAKQAQSNRLGYELLFTALLCLSGIGILAVLILAPIWISEAVFQERENSTLDGLLLTTVDRERLLWAKLLGRLRPLLLMMIGSGVMGGVLGAVLGWKHSPINWCVLGVVWGLVLGANLLGGGVARGAYGLIAAVRTRSRLRVTARAVWSPFFLLVFQFLAVVLLLSMACASGYAEVMAHEDKSAILVLVGAVLVTALLVAAKVLVLDLHIAATAIEELAVSMDEFLIEGRASGRTSADRMDEPSAEPVEWQRPVDADDGASEALDAAEEPEVVLLSPEARRRRLRKRLVLATALLLVFGALGVFCWRVVIPFYQTHDAVQRVHGAGDDYTDTAVAQIERLGGPKRALVLLRRYMWLPQGEAPHQFIVILMMAECGPDAVPEIARHVEHDDVDVRHNVVFALGEMKDPRGSDALLQALKDSDSRVRAAAAGALGEIRTKAAIKPLMKALGDSDKSVRTQAVVALGRLEAVESGEKLIGLLADKSADVRANAAWAVGTLEVEAAGFALAKLLDDKTESVREQASWALMQLESLPEEAVAGLVKSLKDPSDEVRGYAARALGQAGLHAEKAIPALIGALTDKDRNVRAQAACALEELRVKTKDVVAPVRKLTNDKDGRLRLVAHSVLWRVTGDGKRALPALVKGLGDPDDEVRDMAACLLARAGVRARAALPALKRALGDKSEYVRESAAEAIKKIETAQEKMK